jgi:hypothetical protein
MDVMLAKDDEGDGTWNTINSGAMTKSLGNVADDDLAYGDSEGNPLGQDGQPEIRNLNPGASIAYELRRLMPYPNYIAYRDYVTLTSISQMTSTTPRASGRAVNDGMSRSVTAATTILKTTRAIIGDFRAVFDGQAIVEWETLSERGTIGFNLYRKDEASGKFTKLNTELLIGLLHSPSGGTYRFADPGAEKGKTYTYQLEELDSFGRLTSFDPVSLKVEDTPADFALIALENGYGKKAREMSDYEKARIEARALVSEGRSSRTAQSEVIKVAIRQDGLYTLDAQKIADIMGSTAEEVAGWIAAYGLKLSSGGQEVPYMQWNNNQAILFYGKAIDSLYTLDNIYLVERGSGITLETSALGDVNGYNGTTIADAIVSLMVSSALPVDHIRQNYATSGVDVNGNNQVDPAEAVFALIKEAGLYDGTGNTGTVPETFTSTVHAEQDKIELPHLYQDPEADYWMWDYSVPSVHSITQTIRTPGKASAGKAHLTIGFMGGSVANHHAYIRLNNTLVGDLEWKDTNPAVVTLEFEASLLIDGENSIQISGNADPRGVLSVFYLDDITLTYPRYFRADADLLEAVTEVSGTILISGFSSAEILVIDITNPANPQLLTDVSVESAIGNTWQVRFRSGDGTRHYMALTSAAFHALTSDKLTADLPSTLKNTNNQADYVIITTQHLMQTAQSLADYRSGQGLKTMVVNIEDIYDEFNYGVSTPKAIRAFLAYAVAGWNLKPKYVLLAGEGSFDYRNNRGFGDSLIPPLMTYTPEGLSPSDMQLADISGNDGVPDLAIGRVSVLNTTELQAFINKVTAYEADSGDWTSRALFLVDNPDGYHNFPKDSDTIKALFPNTFTIDEYMTTDPNAKTSMINAWNDGRAFFNYVGHGGYNIFSDEKVLELEDIPSLNSGSKLPVVTALTCLIGQFGYPGVDAMNEQLVLKANGGAIAVWAPSGQAINDCSIVLGQGFYQTRFTKDGRVLGDIIKESQKAYALSDKMTVYPYHVLIYNLMGDPATLIK